MMTTTTTTTLFFLFQLVILPCLTFSEETSNINHPVNHHSVLRGGAGVAPRRTTTSTSTTSTTTTSTIDKIPVNFPHQSIVGGTTVSGTNDYPFYGFPQGSNNCGATLIHNDIMLSAAHCQRNFRDGILLGGNRINGMNSDPHDVDFEIPHPDYDDDTLENDIMLIKLSEPSSNELVQLNFGSNAIDIQAGEDATLIGYGALSEDGYFSWTLQQVQVYVEDDDYCASVYDRFRKGYMVCNSYPGGGRDSCQGDSGGPLLDSNTMIQIGLVSFGQGCGRDGYPSVNTRIDAYQEFITQGICEFSDNPPASCFEETNNNEDDNDDTDDSDNGEEAGKEGNEDVDIPNNDSTPATTEPTAPQTSTTTTATTNPLDAALDIMSLSDFPTSDYPSSDSVSSDYPSDSSSSEIPANIYQEVV